MNVVLWRIDSFGHLACISELKYNKYGIFKMKTFEYINSKKVGFRRTIKDFTMQT